MTDNCEFVQADRHEWYCTIHHILMVAGTQEPNSCGFAECSPVDNRRGRVEQSANRPDGSH